MARDTDRWIGDLRPDASRRRSETDVASRREGERVSSADPGRHGEPFSLDVVASPICPGVLDLIMSDIGNNYGYYLVIILLDECGDLGRSPGSSRNFLVAAMMVYNPKELVRLIKNARKKLGKTDWKGERKFNNTADPIRKFILESVAKLDCQIAWVSFDKNTMSSAMLKDEKHSVSGSL